MTKLVRVGIWTAVGLMVLTVVAWRLWPSQERANDPYAGWPKTLSMTCISCSHRYDVSSKDYLAGIEAMRKGEPSVGNCPACKSHDVTRTDHLGRPPRYTD
ncbi:MAG: hypothetical protein MI923_12630 [Phycisphaerales bacterium]|nr:hypothetical protein [Phycisphaerales bacterium]